MYVLNGYVVLKIAFSWVYMPFTETGFPELLSVFIVQGVA